VGSTPSTTIMWLVRRMLALVITEYTLACLVVTFFFSCVGFMHPDFYSIINPEYRWEDTLWATRNLRCYHSAPQNILYTRHTMTGIEIYQSDPATSEVVLVRYFPMKSCWPNTGVLPQKWGIPYDWNSPYLILFFSSALLLSALLGR
jgi:hypothetical protein